MNRSRIVVDIAGRGARPAGATRGAGGGAGGCTGGSTLLRITAAVVVVIAIVLLVVGAGTLYWWHGYKQGPAYSLALLVDAAQRGDSDTVNKLIDTDRVVDSLVPQVRESIVGQAGGLLGALSKQFDTLVPKVLPAIKQAVRDGVTNEIKELSARAAGKPFLLIALAIPYAADIKQEGEAATVTLKSSDRHTELQMQHNAAEGRWTVVSVKDDVLVARIVAELAKQLPALGGGGGGTDRQTRRKPNTPSF